MRGKEEDYGVNEENDFDLENNHNSEKDLKKSLADKYIVKTKQPIVKKSKGRRYFPLVIILFILAFIAGAVPGFFNFSQLNTKDNNTLQINETAFPPVITNNVTEQVNTSNNIEQNNVAPEPEPDPTPTPDPAPTPTPPPDPAPTPL
jgi:hypothetical protein